MAGAPCWRRASAGASRACRRAPPRRRRSSSRPRYAKSARNKERGGISLRTTIRITDDAGAPAPLQLTHTTAALPEGRGRERALLPQVQPGGAAPARPARLPEGLEDRLGHGPIGLAPPIVQDPVNAKITLFNGTLRGRQPDASSSTRSPTSAR